MYFRGGIFPAQWDFFRTYGPSAKARFDHHVPPPSDQHRSILYAAHYVSTCIAEVFQEDRTIDRSFNQPALAGFRTTRDVFLLDLRGPWSTAAGASMAISTGRKDFARGWSRSIYEAYPNVEGLWYSSSMDANNPAVALYERAQRCIPVTQIFDEPLTHPSLLGALVQLKDRFGYELV